MIPLDAFDELAEGLDHPEGVAWNPSDGRVYAGGERGETLAGGGEDLIQGNRHLALRRVFGYDYSGSVRSNN